MLPWWFGACDMDAGMCVQSSSAALHGAGPDATYLQLSAAQESAIVALAMLRSGQLVRLCTGTIVAPGWVLSAAHCLTSEIDSVSLRVGRDALNPELEAELTPADFTIDAERDLAVGSVPDSNAAAFAEIKPIAAMDEMLDRTWIGERVQLAGYGVDARGVPGLRAFLVELVQDVGDRFITVEGNGSSGACEGDSGGPLLLRATDGSVRVAAVLSMGSASCTDFDLYTRLDLAADFLSSKLEAPHTPALGCEAIDRVGRCFGTRAVYCDQTLHAELCDGGRSCGFDRALGQFRCTNPVDDPCQGSDEFGRCDGDTALRCVNGALERIDCARCGERCSPHPASGIASCW